MPGLTSPGTPVRGRYAPSPTGDLHPGNLRTALLAWLYARTAHGQFALRIEDLDQPRVRPQATERMIADLLWLGLDWDEGPDVGGSYAPYTQSERLDIYQQQLQKLIDAGRVYSCYCTRAEIARVASAPHEDEGPAEPRYPGTCRTLTQTQRRAYKASGRRPSLRLRVDDERLVSFSDLIAGTVQQRVSRTVGDFIIRRSDSIFSYQFAVVVDDALMRLNQIVRGADLLSSTPRQILLYEALGFPIPTFAHVPLVLDEQGKRFSKRSASAGLEPLRTAGLTPTQVVGQFAASCRLLPAEESINPPELAKRFTPAALNDIMRSMIQTNI